VKSERRKNFASFAIYISIDTTDKKNPLNIPINACFTVPLGFAALFLTAPIDIIQNNPLFNLIFMILK
jgi:hypothetical protein